MSREPLSDEWAMRGREIVRAVLAAADPSAAVTRQWPIAELAGARVRLLVIGKAAVPMARTALGLLDRPEPRVGHAGPAATLVATLVVTSPHPDSGALGVETIVADHPLATDRNLAASARVEAFVRAASGDEVVLVLLSGGGSALLTAPAQGLGLEDLRAATRALLRAGAPISELNAVRKHCERLKGGRLAGMIGAESAHEPACDGSVSPSDRPRVIALVVSDVLGDPLDVISSGPLSADPTTFAQALRVLEDRGVASALPRVVAHLTRGVRGEIAETPKPGDAALARVSARIIAGNQGAALAARDAVLSLGFGRVKVVCRVEGEAASVGRSLVREALDHHAEGAGPSCIILAGETTVVVGDTSGVGGRNQELALAAALELGNPIGRRAPAPSVCVLTLATDGVDGPTDAAGAIVTADTLGTARTRGIDLADALARHDSHHALDAVGCLIRTGPTGTNVNDIAVAMVMPSA